MLDPNAVDLEQLCAALDDRSLETSWWIHPSDGQIRPLIPDVDDETTDDLAAAGWRAITSIGSHEGYRDMADFVAGVHHRRAAELLDRAITGRGAFRRFKDTLFEFPELREAWFRFRDARARRRALRWLADEGLVDSDAAERAMAQHPDPPADDEDVPAAIAVDLAKLYGDRLERVLLFGSWATGDGPGEDAVELAVVLADLRSPWEELRAMDEVLWRHAERSGLAIVAVPASTEQLTAPESALLRRAVAEAVQVA